MSNGFDMRNQQELNSWMAQTLQFSMVSAGRNEIDEQEVHDEVRAVTKSLPAQLQMRDVASSILQRASALLGEEREVPNEEIDPSYVVPVMQWCLKTLAVVHIARKKPFVHERLEALAADKIVDGIQGNRTHARRDDLDKIVRKTINWGLQELGLLTAA